ncbi:MAG TPA: glycosyltransferase family 39 protein, partial [Bryocella sp.]|nr:glycosyltransferase family 39 protein [Bryocella sp.]
MQAAQTKPDIAPDSSSLWRVLCDGPGYFLLLTFAALSLRLFFYFRFPHVTGDTLVYGDIAKNWLDHGIFGLTHSSGVRPTLIRLPGYPAFLALCFVLFGKEHYNAVLLVQIVVDVVTCFVVVDLARRTVSVRAARIAFLLAALCPFTANYTAAPLAETLSVFCVAVALDAAAAALIRVEQGSPAWRPWIGCGAAIACGILLRPDGGILLVALGLYLVWNMWRSPAERAQVFWAGALVLAISLAPLAPWTIRNWREFHRFQPLVPQSASDPDEFVP